MSETKSRPVLVVGAGIAGMTAALEAAEAGQEVILVEKEPAIGGRVVRNHQYFPKMCPPVCGMEINVGRLERNPRIELRPGTRVIGATRTPQGYSVTLRRDAQYVNERCTACGECTKVCPGKVPDPFNAGMCQVPAIRIYFGEAHPRRFTLDRAACPQGCKACVDACRYAAIDLAAEPTEETLEVAAVVLATGWKPYPLEKLPELGGGILQDVLANVHMERLAAHAGPTQGKILVPSSGAAPRRVAFVQCAGSRDVNHLPYCSAVCCLASLKQALYVREQLPEAEVAIYYIDRRTPGRNEEVLTRVAALQGVRLVKGKVGKVERRPDGSLALRVEDTESGRMLDESADLVVLATGMVPQLDGAELPFALRRDEDGFGLDDAAAGIFIAGVAKRPEDVAASARDATGAAAKAMVAATRS